MKEQLEQYNSKRDFRHTNEPKGETKQADNGKLRYVIQHHIASREHYDFRLEWQGVLLSFAVPKGPSFDPKEKRLAIMVEDHPLDYRNFEGTIPKGEYGGGTVMLWDEGFWHPMGDVAQALDSGSLKFMLEGERLKGKWTLVRLADANNNWLLLKEKDEYAKAESGIASYTTSVRTGRSMQEITQGAKVQKVVNPFTSVDIQLASLATTLPKGQDWIYEIKYDGYRILAFIEGREVRLITRGGNDLAYRFSSIATSLTSFLGGRAAVLDGEVAIIDKQGRTDFQALQNYMSQPKEVNLTYIIFDILALDGVDLRAQPLQKRKEVLQNLLQDAPSNLYYSNPLQGDGEQILEAACSLGLEGIVAKKADSIYTGERSGDWLKLKCVRRQEFVVGGYTLSDKKSTGISSLLLGVQKEGKLQYMGRVGSGISERRAEVLLDKFALQEKSPFSSMPKTKRSESITWVEPNVVVEAAYNGLTEDGLLRQASYKGIREDKVASEVIMEKPEREKDKEQNKQNGQPISITKKPKTASNVIEGIKISSPDKVVFAEKNIKKIDVVSYYSKVAGTMLPYMRDRLLSVVRCPKGAGEPCFFKKHPLESSKEIIPFSIDDDKDYFYINTTKGIIAEAQLGTLEFHLWASKVDALEQPDMMVFDLDPDEGMDIGQVRQGVLDLKGILDHLGLTSFLKTSGNKGYHIVLPFLPSPSWQVFSDFAKRIAQVMETKWQERYTTNMRKEKRRGKIFIDWVRNGRGATSVCPYSLRAKEQAAISAPISWQELDTIAPDDVTADTMLMRLMKKDPWADFFDIRQSLK